MSKPQITVLGSINLDLVATCASLPTAGETVLGGSFAKHQGGKGANQALAAQRLGGAVSMIGRVGEDSEAELALSLLRKAGVDLSGCAAIADAPTGVALIGVSEAGENQIIVAPGANETINPSDLPASIDTALIAQLEVPVETVAAAAQHCSGLVAVNLAPAAHVPDALLTRADLLIVNEPEADFYGREALFAAGGLTALTLGARGAELYRDGKKIAACDGMRVDVTDTTGAGDTFVGALVTALLEEKSPADALAFACAAGALSTTKPGAQPAMPVRADVDAFLAKQRPQ